MDSQLNADTGFADFYRLALARIRVAPPIATAGSVRSRSCAGADTSVPARHDPSPTRAAGQPLHPLAAGFAASDPRDVAPDAGDAISAWDGLLAALTRSPARFAGSGLDEERADLARDLVAQAACLALSHAGEIRYARGTRRWEGIDRGLRAWRGEYPRQADCSSFATWVLWQALSPFGLGDTVNGTNWQAGYVGTLLQHGRAVTLDEVRVGDLAFYHDDESGQDHVAVCIGGGKVVSHGSDDGPRLIDIDYRGDLRSIRRYI